MQDIYEDYTLKTNFFAAPLPDHDDHASLGPQERENRVIGEVLRKIADDHPKRDDLMQTVKDDHRSPERAIPECGEPSPVPRPFPKL